ncbi:MAG: hypothetical protein U0835_12625 [Isosphaeraceae bacterium]
MVGGAELTHPSKLIHTSHHRFCPDRGGLTKRTQSGGSERARRFSRWYSSEAVGPTALHAGSFRRDDRRHAESNRRNAAASTGPTSDEGKAVSRANALTHGLSGTGIVLSADEAAEVARREADWTAVFRPANPVEAFLVRQYAVESVRVERCQAVERVIRDGLVVRAYDHETWTEDRRLEAEEIGARLARDPARTVRRLRQTAQGCDWLITRWEGLARALEPGRTWDDAQRALALDLMGVPASLRDGPTAADPADGPDPAVSQRALAAGQVEELRRIQTLGRTTRDAHDRTLALVGVATGDGNLQRALRLVRRYESECHRRMLRTQQLLLNARPAPAPVPGPESVPDPSAPPEAGSADEDPDSPIEPSREPAPSATDHPRGNRRWRKEQQRRERLSRSP